MKHQYVSDLTPGDAIDDVFVLAEKNLAQKKDGNSYLTVTLADKTGTIGGVVWDNVERIAAAADSGDFVQVTARVTEYRGNLQATVNAMAKCPPERVDLGDFLPATRHDADQLFERLVHITDGLDDPSIHALLKAFWEDREFVSAFKQAPAAKMMHHAYVGGLLEHCLSMAVLADKMARHYSGIDRDLLMAGAILHDIGKVREFEYQTRIDYSDEGRLVGHIVIGLEMIEEKLATIDGFPEETAMLLKHLIISHHGALEFGSPEPPKTIEALLLHYIDEIDSKVNGVREFMATQDPGEAWTAYHRVLGRHFYKGKTEA